MNLTTKDKICLAASFSPFFALGMIGALGAVALPLSFTTLLIMLASSAMLAVGAGVPIMLLTENQTLALPPASEDPLLAEATQEVEEWLKENTV